MKDKPIAELDLPELDAAIAELGPRLKAMRRRRRALLLAQANVARGAMAANSDERVMQIYWDEGGGSYGSKTRTASRTGIPLRQVNRVVRRNAAWLQRKAQERKDH